jgi:lipopolysaccharide heptosyltransferase I
MEGLQEHGSTLFSRILIIKPSSLGDIIHTLPLAHALKRCFPGSHLGWIVQDVFADLLRRDPAVDDVYPISIVSTSDPRAGRSAWLRAGQQTLATLRDLRRTFARKPYDLVLDLHASFRGGLLGRTNPGGVRMGFADARELNTLFQNTLVAVPEAVEHALEKNLLFAAQLGCRPEDENFFMACAAEDRRAVEEFLESRGVDKDRIVLYANPAARWQTKFWPTDRWARLADRFAHRNMVMIFGGSAQDREYIATITRDMRTPAVVAAGECSLPQTVALLQRSALYVGLDSGPMHMAALCATPVVALFGPTHPSRVGPYRVRHRIVRAEELGCLECRKRSCSQLACMEGITVEKVEEAALELLAEGRKEWA